MIPVPSSLFERYQAHLKAENLSADKSFEYQNWLRYFLDFCEKHKVAALPSERLHQFLDKLKDKGRTEESANRLRIPSRFTSRCNPPL